MRANEIQRYDCSTGILDMVNSSQRPHPFQNSLNNWHMPGVPMPGVPKQPDFAQHVTNIIQRAGVRRGVLANLAKAPCETEAGIMRSAAKALLISLVRFGRAFVGAGAYVGK